MFSKVILLQQLFTLTNFNKIALVLQDIKSKDTPIILVQQSAVLIQPFVCPSSCVYGC